MISQKKILSTAVMATMLGTASLAYADGFGLSNNDVVRDSRGNVVHSLLFGNCVRTMWEAGHDACAVARRSGTQVVQHRERVIHNAPTVFSSEERTVYFEFNSSNLTSDAKRKLDSLADRLKSAVDVQSAQIVGYADRKGAVSYNQNLSKKRAEAVKNYLAKQGYLNTQVADVRGLGESTPVTSCDTSLPREREIECLSPDRRVEVEIQYIRTSRR